MWLQSFEVWFARKRCLDRFAKPVQTIPRDLTWRSLAPLRRTSVFATRLRFGRCTGPVKLGDRLTTFCPGNGSSFSSRLLPVVVTSLSDSRFISSSEAVCSSNSSGCLCLRGWSLLRLSCFQDPSRLRGWRRGVLLDPSETLPVFRWLLQGRLG